MRFPSRFFPWKATRKNVARGESSVRSRLSRLECLEAREMLSLSTSSADYKALVAANSFGDSDENAIWVTSLSDTVSVSDGKITLREALDYAGQSLSAGNVSTTIRFSAGGVVTLSATRQSLKINKSVTIDASDVGGITIKAQNTLAFYLYGGSNSTPLNVSLIDVATTGGGSSSTGAKGGAFQVASYCNLTMRDCSVSNNSASSALGVGVYMTNGVLSLDNVVFEGNSSSDADGKGGAIYLESGAVYATNGVFSGNEAADGGAVYVKNGTTSFDNCLFDGNSATLGSGGALSTSSQFSIENSAFRNNAAAVSGGAIYVNGDVESNLSDVGFLANTARDGGAIAQDGQSLEIVSANFRNNTATGNGGALSVAQNALLIAEDVSFVQNGATNGGAVYNGGSFYLTTGTLEENESENSGGAVYSTGYLEARDAEFTNNAAGASGGSFYLEGARRSWLIRSTISSSKAEEGGGIYNAGSLTLAEASIVDNVSATSGGGIANAGVMLVSYSEIKDNIASGSNAVGGGILNFVNATLDVEGSALSGNLSESGSGGAVANSGTTTINGSAMTNNAAYLFGGAIFNSGVLSSQYASYDENEATYGGAIANVYGSSSTSVGDVFWGNVASDQGGALYSYGTSSFQSAAFAYNAASTANVAVYYAPDESYAPSFDSATSFQSNVAASSTENVRVVETVAVFDESSREKVDGALLFGSVPVNGATRVKTLSLVNVGSTDLLFSNFSVVGNAGNSVLSYTLFNANGDALDPSVDFTVASGEKFTLEINVSPKTVGAKFFKLSWNTSELDANGAPVAGAEKTFLVQGAVEITKLAPSTSSVATLEENADFNISANANGSFSLRLSRKPSSDAIVYLKTSTNAIVLSTDVLLFTTTNYNVAQTVTVSLDQEKLAELGVLSEITVLPVLLESDSYYAGMTFSEISLNVADYVVFREDGYVNLDEYESQGVCRWDLDGDGIIEAISYGSGYWINASSVEGDVIVCKRVQNGKTVSDRFDVVYANAAPTATATVTEVAGLLGFTRVDLASDGGGIARWRIDWGDGSPYSVFDQLSTSATFAHSYATDGSYDISVELVDDGGVGEGIWTTIARRDVTGISATNGVMVDVDDVFLDELLPDNCVDVAAGAILAEFVEEKTKK